MASALLAQEQGISATLAKERAKLLSAIQYELHFDLEEGARQATGKITIRFNLKTVGDVILDSALVELTQIAINGAEQEPGHVRQVNNHLVLPKTALVEGANSVQARFTTQVASTGTPLTIYHDTKRNEDFVYTLVAQTLPMLRST